MEKVYSKDGTTIGFRRSGEGNPLLLVHGTTADHQRWASISPHLEQHFTIYAMDRRGRGGSGDAPEYDIIREAEDIAAVVNAVADETGGPVSVLGHSYGALCSLEATLLTNNMNRLVLYEPPVPTGTPIIAPDVPERMQTLINNGDLEAALVLFMREGPKMPEHELKAYRQLPMWPTRVQLAPTIPREIAFDKVNTFNAKKFRDVQIPTMLLLGGDSPPSFHKGIQLLDSVLPNSKIVTMLGQQHIAMDLNPDLFIKEVLNFLQE